MPRKILIVEDHQDFREIVATVLCPAGYEVIDAVNGEEGINKAIANTPDLIIMDLGLPGMNGIEATIRLKQNPKTAGIPVIAYTVWGDEFKDRAMEAGMANFLSKTTPPQIFKEVIERSFTGQVVAS